VVVHYNNQKVLFSSAVYSKREDFAAMQKDIIIIKYAQWAYQVNNTYVYFRLYKKLNL